MEKYVVLAVMIVGLVGLIGMIGSSSLTGMASQSHVFLSENICGSPDLVPAMAKVTGPGRPHNIIYECIPKSEAVVVTTGGFKLYERQKAKNLKDYFYIYKQKVR